MAVDGQRFMTKTQHYRKITKPLLERKRRARMNLYLDELKELIVDSMAADGEHIAKLEKADILELTVSYLREQLQRRRPSRTQHQHHTHGHVAPTAMVGGGGGGAGAPYNPEKYCAGYTQAAYEVSKVFATLPGVDLKFGTQLLKHLGGQLREFKTTQPPTRTATQHSPSATKPTAAAKPKQTTAQHTEPAAATVADAQLNDAKAEDVWRPW